MDASAGGAAVGVNPNSGDGGVHAVSWRVSILKDNGMFQTNCIVCIKRQSQSQLIVRSAVITSVMSVLLCREMSGELFLSGARHDSQLLYNAKVESKGKCAVGCAYQVFEKQRAKSKN